MDFSYAVVTVVLLLLELSFPFTSYAATVKIPSYPLAVKSPYLSTWLPGNQTDDLATGQPEFWNGIPLTWMVLARVDGTTYSLLGNPQSLGGATPAKTTSVSYSSTHTCFYLQSDEVDFLLDFFSPVAPGKDEYALQSLPYSYLTVNVHSLDNKTHEVQILSAIDQSWTGQNGSAVLNYTTSGPAGFFHYYNDDADLLTEVNEQAVYGSVVFGMNSSFDASHGCGSASGILSSFISRGSLMSNSTSSCSGSDLAALVQETKAFPDSAQIATFVVGFDRLYAINYLGDLQTGYHHTQWPSIPDQVGYALQDFGSIWSRSLVFDNEVRSRSEAVSASFGSEYADVVEASVRQAFGGMEITVPIENSTASPSAFLKEISSDGNVNTIDFIFQSWPIFISLNPEYIKILLDPILSYLNSGRWPQPYVIHDIGTHYPNADGHDDGDEESMPLFETSSLFILMYAYQMLTDDSSFAEKYSSLLEGYAGYLTSRSLYPEAQLISVDTIYPTANQTGLAIQSAIGLKAASLLINNSSYAEIASSIADAIYEEGLGLDGASPDQSTHFTYNYGNDTTWGVVFPSFSDVFLNLSTFPRSAWDMQSSFYSIQIMELGLPFVGPADDLNYTDAPPTWGITDWNIVAASTCSEGVQAKIVQTTHHFMTNGLNDIPFGTRYYVEGPDAGQWIANENRASVGSHFALMTMQQGTWYNSSQ